MALLVAIVGSAGLGAVYGAVIALCGEIYVNIAMACSVPFWVNVPAKLGMMWGRLQHPKWCRYVERVGFAACLYAMCVGWLAGVLDGPGLVLHPLQLFRHLCDSSLHGIWVNGVSIVDLTKELPVIGPYLLAIRLGEMAWIAFGGLMCMGATIPFPYCRPCRRWMLDNTTLRLACDVSSTDDARKLAQELVDGDYHALMQLNRPLGEKAKGLEVCVYACDRCGHQHVMDVKWYRTHPDPGQTEVERMLESAAGLSVVSKLKIPCEVKTHIEALEQRRAA